VAAVQPLHQQIAPKQSQRTNALLGNVTCGAKQGAHSERGPLCMRMLSNCRLQHSRISSGPCSPYFQAGEAFPLAGSTFGVQIRSTFSSPVPCIV
jgi:hypothetical protein